MDSLLTAFAQWILATDLHKLLIGSGWIFPAAETVHFMALTLFFGALLLVDIRGLGFYKHIDFKAAHRFVPVALIAFAFILLSGLVFIFSDPNRYFVNIAFQLKMVLVVLAGINALAFELWVFKPYKNGNTAVLDSAHTKIISGLSLLAWSLVLILGRSIPYLEY